MLKNISINNFKVLINFVSILFLICIANYSCTQSSQNKPEKNLELKLVQDTSIKFAKRFAISIGSDFKIVHLFGKASDNKDTTANFVVYQANKPNVNISKAYFIKAPCTQIISLSSIYSNMIAELNCINNIIAIENSDYYNNPAILENVKKGKIKEVQRNQEIDKELVLTLKPDIIFAFGMRKATDDFDPKIVESGIPIVISLDHLESSPLARAEWIKFFAVFVNKEKEADQIFRSVVQNYYSLKRIATSFKNRPTVFSELKYGDTWYVPGGKSFMAQLIHDANANYLWSDDTVSGSLPLSFEAVYKKANKADYWLNVSMCSDKKQILAQDKRYGDFLAFQKDNIYNNNLHCNKLNYTNYWETGMIYPNQILSDLIKIFHKEAIDSIKNDFYYYKAIK